MAHHYERKVDKFMCRHRHIRSMNYKLKAYVPISFGTKKMATGEQGNQLRIGVFKGAKVRLICSDDES